MLNVYCAFAHEIVKAQTVMVEASVRVKVYLSSNENGFMHETR